MNKRSSARFVYAIFLCFVPAYLAFLIVFPDESSRSIRDALTICGEIVVPSIFPFTCLSMFIYLSPIRNIMERAIKKITHFLYRSDGIVGMIWLMSVMGGYPIGAQLIAKAAEDGSLSRRDAGKMLGCCVNGGPAFMIVAVGCGILRSKQAGILIFIANTVSSWILSLFLLRGIRVKEKQDIQDTGSTDAIVESISAASKAMFALCGFILFFRNFYACASKLFGLPFGEIVGTVCEVTTAAFCLKDKPIGLMALCLAFGGISVHFQVFVLCRNIRIRYGKFYRDRLLHGLLSALLVTGLEKLFPIRKAVVSVGTIGAVGGAKETAAFSFGLLLISVVLMAYSRYIVRQK